MAEPYASPGWSGLAIDLLIHVVQLLELPEALAFRAVCPLWRSASTAAAGVPRTCQTPWLVSLVTDPVPREKQSRRACDPSVSFKFLNVPDEKTYQVSLPQGKGKGKAVALCGASHGWLVLANELSNLVLYDPFAMTTIPLPPITGFSKCIQGVYGDDGGGNLEGYRYLFYRGGDATYDVVAPGMTFYDKLVLSGSPSAAAGAIALIVHTAGKQLSFARAGGAGSSSAWRLLASMIERATRDSFADVIHHRGSRFYALTMKGVLVSFKFSRRNNKPKRETIIARDDKDVITRYLVSAPWGHLLQIRVILDTDRKKGVRVEIDRLDLIGRRMVGLSPTKALRGHTVFLGQNSPGVLSADKFPELRPDCIYFTTPWLKNKVAYGKPYNRWRSSVKVYDLKKQTLEPSFQCRDESYERASNSQEVWFTPSQLPYKAFTASLPSLYDSH